VRIKISEKYNPLFDRPKGVDTYIVTGGRFSSKSYSVAIASVNWAARLNHRILYGRYTNVSGKDSTFPEVEEKIKLMGWNKAFNITNNRIEGVLNDSKIVFKGFKTGSNTQTASLKSLKDFSSLIIEEAEEIPDFDTYEKVSLSIRGNSNESEEPNIKVLILNPVTKEHWIYKEFFESKGVQSGFNGVKDNVCYIHTSYLDCLDFVPEDIIRSFDAMKIHKPKRYEHIVLGGWLDKLEGCVIEDWTIGEFDESLPSVYGMDFGYVNDPTTLVKIATDDKNIYTELKLHKVGMSTTDIINFLENNVHVNDLILADCAEPRLIEELRYAGFNVVACRKGKDSIKNGLARLNEKTIICREEDIELHKELNNYVWNDKKSNTPIDNWNHIIDALRYGYDELIQENDFYFV
jgi:phage terminase large subunit